MNYWFLKFSLSRRHPSGDVSPGFRGEVSSEDINFGVGRTNKERSPRKKPVFRDLVEEEDVVKKTEKEQ